MSLNLGWGCERILPAEEMHVFFEFVLVGELGCQVIGVAKEVEVGKGHVVGDKVDFRK